jgi:hypothetical protein
MKVKTYLVYMEIKGVLYPLPIERKLISVIEEI